MNLAQRFFGFAGKPDDAKNIIRVNVQGGLYLTTTEGTVLPPSRVRIVPGHLDDLLMAAPDLDKWELNPSSNSNYFVLKRLGISHLGAFQVPTSTTTLMLVDWT